MGPCADAETPSFFPPFRLDGNPRQRGYRLHFVQVACHPWLPIAGTKASTLAGRVEVGKQQTVWVLRPVEREVSPYRFVGAVKAFPEEVTRVGVAISQNRVGIGAVEWSRTTDLLITKHVVICPIFALHSSASRCATDIASCFFHHFPHHVGDVRCQSHQSPQLSWSGFDLTANVRSIVSRSVQRPRLRTPVGGTSNREMHLGQASLESATGRSQTPCCR